MKVTYFIILLLHRSVAYGARLIKNTFFLVLLNVRFECAPLGTLQSPDLSHSALSSAWTCTTQDVGSNLSNV